MKATPALNLLFVALTTGFITWEVTGTFHHWRGFNKFEYRTPAPPFQPFFPLFPNFHASRPQVHKPVAPVAPSTFPDVHKIVRFHLYTRNNQYSPEELNIDVKRTHPSTYFRAIKKTKILIHGFVDSATDSSSGEWMTYMRDAYLNAEDVNVIVVDYSFIALLIFYWTNLPQMSSIRIAELACFLNNNGAPLDTIHLVGRSWGAHVAGMAGHTLNGKIGRITGLDPVNPPFRFIGFQYRLDKTDAKFVDVYHLNGKNMFNLLDAIGIYHRYDGLSPPMGHVDVYPNHSVRQQTGCPIVNASMYTSTCRLGMGSRIFTETIKRSSAFYICPCEEFLKYLRGDCKCDATNIVPMGEHISQELMGVYQISQSSEPQPKPTEDVPILSTTTSTTTTTSTSSTTSTSIPEDAPAASTTVIPTTTSTTSSPETSSKDTIIISSVLPESPATTAAPTTVPSTSVITSTTTTESNNLIPDDVSPSDGSAPSNEANIIPDEANPEEKPSSPPESPAPPTGPIIVEGGVTDGVASSISSTMAPADEVTSEVAATSTPEKELLSEDGQSASSSALGRVR